MERPENGAPTAPAAPLKRYVVRYSRDYSCIVEARSVQEAIDNAPPDDSPSWVSETSQFEAEEEE